MDRRQYLQRVGGAAGFGLLAATAGCGGTGNGDDTTEPSDGEEPTTEPSMATTPDSTEPADRETTEPAMVTTTERSTSERVTATTDPAMATTDPGTTRSSEPSITIEGFAFEPLRLRVEPGTTVEWTNDDGASHTVVAADLTGESDDWSFDESLGGGESTTHTFESAGVYEYFCDLHGEKTMCGTVFVGDAAVSAGLPCE